VGEYLLSECAHPKVVLDRIRTATLIGGIVGGVVGGLLILAIGALCYYLRRKKSRPQQMPTRDYVLSQYSPEPFMDTRPTSENINKWGSGHSSTTPLFSLTSSELASMSASGSGSGGYYRTSDFGSRIDPPSELPSPSQREPWDVGVIQHEDSGVTLLSPTEQPIVELPPRYDNIGTQDRPSLEVLLESQNRI